MRRIRYKKTQQKKVSLIPKAISAGFFGALIWATIAAVAGYFHFTEVTPKSFILRPWLQTAWSDGWLGEIVSIFVLCCLSIGLALLYYLFLRKIPGMLPGILTGIVLWFMFFWLLSPIFPNIAPFWELSSDTVVTTICIFILYGVFIGYSISFSYEQHKDEKK
ncbi:YqhR family membrane protein [Gracilibacillus sp. S3-1-1]|uniref:YqhR family membrane protein n=1 Tax=Gracilibacillus pellucidus TaxID=3095368 RepID=A0ACC6M4V4_9BACI|nr:YqhR family membrane protein [Gracilibacillus sp. S3-1-1]MDX8046011.1 YqhR family membrane protein [Gracilibacillus sp. S3-1-1]